MTLTITSTPTPGAYYRAKSTDTWLGLTGRAYGARSGSARRLALSKMANNHPRNWRLHRDPKNEFERTHYPDGLVSLSRRFSCDEADFDTAPQNKIKSGSCRPIIYIPPANDVWLSRPSEVVQATDHMCWAAALSSLSRARKLKHRFRSQKRLARVAFKKVTLSDTTGIVRLVDNSTDAAGVRKFGLRVVPNVANTIDGIRRGEATIAELGDFMGLSYTPFFGDAGPGVNQAGVDARMSVTALHNLLELFGEPVLLLRCTGSGARGAGHVSAVFGASITDDIYFEMDPFKSGPSGPVFGRRRTRALRDGTGIGSDPFLTPSQEIYVMF